jgi:hypothetical protein
MLSDTVLYHLQVYNNTIAGSHHPQGAVILYMYRECRPLNACLPCVFSTFSNISAASAAGFCHKLAAEQLLDRAGGTVRHGPPITSTNNHSFSPLLQLGRTGRRVGSMLTGLLPL